MALLLLSACGSGTERDGGEALPAPVTATSSTSTSAVTEPAPPVTTAPAPAPAAATARPARVAVLPGIERAPRAARAVAPARSGPAPIGRIQIPRIRLDHAIYEGHTLDVLKYGPGHWSGTAMPGSNGNTVFPGHRTTHTRPFWDIDLIQRGDPVVFATDAGRFTYRVTETFVVDDSETWIANGTKDATFTIFACHPKGSAKQRYVVKGVLERSEPKAPPPPPPTTTTSTTAAPCVLCLG